MDLKFTREQELFREEVRSWLAANQPREPRPPSTEAAARDFDLAWQRTLYDGGWAGIAWPKEYGGRGLDTFQQLIYLQEYARADAPDEGFRFNGLNLGGPTIIACGSAEQKAQYLPPILRGETIWCQGFSEPRAGSDLAALATKGVVDGDELVISGQKIWTSYARFADYQQVLVRTDPNSSRSKGISWVINKMDNPGMRVVPIKDMAAGDDLHEVFYDEVRVPLTDIVGGLNNGWRVSMAQLSFERGTAFMPLQVRLARTIEDLIETAKVTPVGGGRFAIQDDDYARRLAQLRAEVRALQAMTLLAVSRNERRGAPGAEGSMQKLFYSELVKKLGNLAVEILGARRVNLSAASGRWPQWLLWSFGVAIGGGTSEIQRNIIGERVLGLPR